MLLYENRICPESQAASVFPSIFNVLRTEDDRDDVSVVVGIGVIDRQTASSRCRLACFDPRKSWEVQQFVRVVPGLVVLDVLDITVTKRHVSILVNRPLGKLVVRQSLGSF